ncbi:hypothetical protein HCN44_004698 [Aphidius gifuensis]|uniref:Transferrin-like domain-containing protein n=1 Tax=Aphidius gifuensis TaxID=684658 RepID=A0A834XZP4_APHGI|nr:transferrin-like [Aphidius gifuensis]KAF7995226.1 hypothetical protein HCN44_004698 [Aphidius gifuensis]
MPIKLRLSSMNLISTCRFLWIINQYLSMIIIFSSISVTSLSTFISDQPKNNLTLCIVGSPNSNDNIKKYCPNMYEGHINCKIVKDRSDCIRQLIAGVADFTVLEAEDLSVTQKFAEGNVFVTHELRVFAEKPASVDMVVLVNGNINSIADIKGKNFCHPGFDANENWTPLFSDYFQEQIVPTKCKPGMTLLETKIAAISNYFNAACFAGKWTSDKIFDEKLKAKYSNLCELCESGCGIGDMYHGRTGALVCLTENIGDIAWVRLDDAFRHFKTDNTNRTLYKYLCSDGSMREVDGGVPCVWISKPSPVIAARKEPAHEIMQLIESTKRWRCKWQLELMSLLANYVVTPYGLGGLKTIESYLNNYDERAFLLDDCSSSIKWCISSNLEEKKCQWLKEYSYYHGIKPGIACIQQQNKKNSIEAVLNRQCDVFVAKPEDLQPKSGLKPILEILPSEKNSYELRKIGIVVMKNSPYKKIEDLRGKKACMTGYKSIGWNSFYGVMRNKSSDSFWRCESSEAVYKFFETIIFPKGESKYDVKSTYECLTSGIGDVAIVDLRDIFYLNKEYLKTICIDGSNDPQCILSWTSLGSVVVNEHMSIARRENIKLLFEELDTWFGSKTIGQTPVISLYGSFDSTDSIIFPAKSENLKSDTSYLSLPHHYRDILDELSAENDDDDACSSAISVFNNVIILMTVLIISLTRFL